MEYLSNLQDVLSSVLQTITDELPELDKLAKTDAAGQEVLNGIMRSVSAIAGVILTIDDLV